MKISFCTPCQNRLFQLRQTIRENLDRIKEDGNSELVIVNYNSLDSLDWFMRQFKKEIDDGIIIYGGEKKAIKYSCPIGKNIAHFIATGDYLMSLDGDNFIDGSIASMRRLWDENPDYVLHYHNMPGDGTYGRIGLSAHNFRRLGGYDELMPDFNRHDTDFLVRAKIAGLPESRVRGEACAIPNPKPITNESYKEMEIIGTHLSNKRIESGIYEVNQGRRPVKIQINWGKDILV